MLKALVVSSWGQDNEMLLLTYDALGKSIASDSSFKKIQTAKNAALRSATRTHMMASIDLFIRSTSH